MAGLPNANRRNRLSGYALSKHKTNLHPLIPSQEHYVTSSLNCQMQVCWKYWNFLSTKVVREFCWRNFAHLWKLDLASTNQMPSLQGFVRMDCRAAQSLPSRTCCWAIWHILMSAWRMRTHAHAMFSSVYLSCICFCFCFSQYIARACACALHCRPSSKPTEFAALLSQERNACK